MSRGVNKVIIVGHLGSDPETKYFPSGGCATNISVATSEAWKDKQTGELKELTEWHRVVFNGRLAEIAGEYLRKGSQVYLEGSLRTRKWQDVEGKDRYTTEVRALQMRMLDSKGTQLDRAKQQGRQEERENPAPQPASQRRPAQQRPAQQSQPVSQPAPQLAPDGFDDFDDDIPF